MKKEVSLVAVVAICGLLATAPAEVLAEGGVAQKIPIRGTWSDLAGVAGWDAGGMEVAEDGAFKGSFAKGLSVQGTRQGDRVTATILADGVAIGSFEGTVKEDGVVDGEYTVDGEEGSVRGSAAFHERR